MFFPRRGRGADRRRRALLLQLPLSALDRDLLHLSAIRMALAMDLLKVDRLSFSYSGASEPALSDICFAVGRGEFVCLTGDSGCGKTTLLLAIKGLLRRG